jgi:putative membrane protein
MRVLCLLFLVAFVTALGIFAYQNQGEIPLTVGDRTFTASIPLVMGGIYLLGMLSGWTVIGMLRQSVNRVIEVPARR